MFLATLLTAAAEPAESPLVDVDGTLFIQFALFLLMLVILSKFLFKPYLKTRDLRGKGIEGAKHEATAMEARAHKMVADYDAQLGRARQRGAEERARLRAEGATRERQLLGVARDEVQKQLDAARGNITKEAQAAKVQLEAQSSALARQVATKVLGREVA